VTDGTGTRGPQSSGLHSGELVTSSIRLIKLLGRGGMGSVWLAEHLRLRTQVVVKFMAPEYVANASAMERFEREATLAAQAKSPHVVQVFDHGISNRGDPYIAMELLDGEDLAQRLERDRIIAPAVYAGWLAQICRGLSRAHSRGIVHRDIKPENIFLCDNDGEILVKVLDFGIAKSDRANSDFSATRTGALLGTAYYMSPEQTMGAKDVDLRSDLWSLGVVSYLALTGVRPFDGSAIGELVMAITANPVAPPSRHNPALGAGIDAWFARALARARDERFASAREFAETFMNAISGVDVQATVRRANSAVLTDAQANASALAPASATDQEAKPLAVSTMAPATSGRAAEPTRRSRSAAWVLTAVTLIAATVGGIALMGRNEPPAGPSAASAANLEIPPAVQPVSPPQPQATAVPARATATALPSSSSGDPPPPPSSAAGTAAASRVAPRKAKLPLTPASTVTRPVAPARPESNPLDMKVE
jgi:serine/threonine protein kinase